MSKKVPGQGTFFVKSIDLFAKKFYSRMSGEKWKMSREEFTLIKETVDAIEAAEKKAEETVWAAKNKASEMKESIIKESEELRASELKKSKDRCDAEMERTKQLCDNETKLMEERVETEISMINHIASERMDETVDAMIKELVG